MKRPPLTPVQAPAPRTHRAFRFLFGSWSLTGLVMMAASIAALLLVTGCGGGGWEDPQPVPTPGVNCQAKPELCQ